MDVENIASYKLG